MIWCGKSRSHYTSLHTSVLLWKQCIQLIRQCRIYKKNSKTVNYHDHRQAEIMKLIVFQFGFEITLDGVNQINYSECKSKDFSLNEK